MLKTYCDHYLWFIFIIYLFIFIIYYLSFIYLFIHFIYCDNYLWLTTYEFKAAAVQRSLAINNKGKQEL